MQQVINLLSTTWRWDFVIVLFWSGCYMTRISALRTEHVLLGPKNFRLKQTCRILARKELFSRQISFCFILEQLLPDAFQRLVNSAHISDPKMFRIIHHIPTFFALFQGFMFWACNELRAYQLINVHSISQKTLLGCVLERTFWVPCQNMLITNIKESIDMPRRKQMQLTVVVWCNVL